MLQLELDQSTNTPGIVLTGRDARWVAERAHPRLEGAFRPMAWAQAYLLSQYL